MKCFLNVGSQFNGEGHVIEQVGEIYSLRGDGEKLREDRFRCGSHIKMIGGVPQPDSISFGCLVFKKEAANRGSGGLLELVDAHELFAEAAGDSYLTPDRHVIDSVKSRVVV